MAKRVKTLARYVMKISNVPVHPRCYSTVQIYDNAVRFLCRVTVVVPWFARVVEFGKLLE